MEQQANSYNTRIRELPSTERPRERLQQLGPGALSTAELLALVLRSGSARQSALSLASALLARHAGLRGLAKLSFAELVRERGVGPAKAAEVQATFQLALRLNSLQPEERAVIRSPEDVLGLVGGEMGLLDQEHLRVILLNTRNQVLGVNEIYKGNVSAALVRVGELFRDAVRQNAASIVLVHNHPSGDPQPSPDDATMTAAAVEAGELLNIEVLDHVVVGAGGRYESLKASGTGFRPRV